mmetsp:Transcript_3777/g.15256  ORF Transcript_3777/g.15256 Transcript_3777/m.15256 type:complete len:251 (-) Transcript_3777:2047-2799(-)
MSPAAPSTRTVLLSDVASTAPADADAASSTRARTRSASLSTSPMTSLARTLAPAEPAASARESKRAMPRGVGHAANSSQLMRSTLSSPTRFDSAPSMATADRLSPPSSKKSESSPASQPSSSTMAQRTASASSPSLDVASGAPLSAPRESAASLFSIFAASARAAVRSALPEALDTSGLSVTSTRAGIAADGSVPSVLRRARSSSAGGSTPGGTSATTTSRPFASGATAATACSAPTARSACSTSSSDTV